MLSECIGIIQYTQPNLSLLLRRRSIFGIVSTRKPYRNISRGVLNFRFCFESRYLHLDLPYSFTYISTRELVNEFKLTKQRSGSPVCFIFSYNAENIISSLNYFNLLNYANTLYLRLAMSLFISNEKLLYFQYFTTHWDFPVYYSTVAFNFLQICEFCDQRTIIANSTLMEGSWGIFESALYPTRRYSTSDFRWNRWYFGYFPEPESRVTIGESCNFRRANRKMIYNQLKNTFSKRFEKYWKLWIFKHQFSYIGNWLNKHFYNVVYSRSSLSTSPTQLSYLFSPRFSTFLKNYLFTLYSFIHPIIMNLWIISKDFKIGTK